MKFYKSASFRKWLGFLFALAIVVGTIGISNSMVEQLKEEEQKKIELFAHAIKLFSTNDSLSSEVTELILEINQKNTSIPVIIVDGKNNLLDSRNIDSTALSTLQKQQELIEDMETYYKPISIKLPDETQKVYYKDSDLLISLRYFPIVLIFLITLFGWFTYWYFTTLKKTEQSFLWAGLAKETAHQIGTPLSSLMGWVEILKLEAIDPSSVEEMNKDIERLQSITERFSKIGSETELTKQNMVAIITETLKYLRLRISKNINLSFETNHDEIWIATNKALLSWVIENLVKNAVDAIKYEGKITLKLSEEKNKIILDICDTGSGIASNHRKKIFQPGFTTKKRGWGLGLSLVYRIITMYHKGKVFVLKSEINKGTTFRITLRKVRK